MKTILVILLLTGAGQAGDLAKDDPLRKTMDHMSAAECCRFEFISIVESDVFESVDSTLGTALIAADERYDIALGPDRYLRTEDLLYSYSGENDQVTLERLDPTAISEETIRFVTRLEEYYRIEPVSDGTYRLTRTVGEQSTLPRSLTLTLTGAGDLDRFVYTDDNGDLNRIVILNSAFHAACDSTSFLPEFPATTEFIKLY